MTKKIELLSTNCYSNFLEPVTGGASALTHKAIVKIRGKSTEVYAKLYPENSKGLINEILGYILARSFGLPLPTKAAVILAPIESLKPHFSQLKGNGPVPLWCVSSIKGKNPAILINQSIWEYQAFIAELRSWKKLHQTAVFDEWLANNDRNGGNLIRVGKNNYFLIDHGEIITGRNWTIPLDWDAPVNNKICKIIWGDKPSKSDKSRLALSSESLEDFFDAAAGEVDKWCKRLLSCDEYEDLCDFIHYRSVFTSNSIKLKYAII